MSDSHALQSLEYRGPEADVPPIWRSIWFRIALGCWALPLLSGSLVFLSWAVFRYRSIHLVRIGFWVIAFGSAAAVIGGIAVIVLLATRWTISRRPLLQAVLPAFGLVVLLASNFPMAILVICAVTWVDPAQYPHKGPPYAH